MAVNQEKLEKQVLGKNFLNLALGMLGTEEYPGSTMRDGHLKISSSL